MHCAKSDRSSIRGVNWIEAHRASIGFLADGLTFVGGGLLARDALLRLRELHRSRVDEEFKRQFPKLNLTDKEWQAAIVTMRWTVAGFALMALGFACQLLLRFVDMKHP